MLLLVVIFSFKVGKSKLYDADKILDKKEIDEVSRKLTISTMTTYTLQNK